MVAASRQAGLQTPIGWVQVILRDDQVVEVDILPEAPVSASARDPLMRRVLDALAGYFNEGCWPEGLPLSPGGTDFQRRVWAAMLAIRPGQTRSYGDIAAELGSSARAVGNACRANPIPLLIPCHRVVAKSGLGGFGGATVGRLADIKASLLAHERTRV